MFRRLFVPIAIVGGLLLVGAVLIGAVETGAGVISSIVVGVAGGITNVGVGGISVDGVLITVPVDVGRIIRAGVGGISAGRGLMVTGSAGIVKMGRVDGMGLSDSSMMMSVGIVVGVMMLDGIGGVGVGAKLSMMLAGIVGGVTKDTGTDGVGAVSTMMSVG